MSIIRNYQEYARHSDGPLFSYLMRGIRFVSRSLSYSTELSLSFPLVFSFIRVLPVRFVYRAVVSLRLLFLVLSSLLVVRSTLMTSIGDVSLVFIGHGQWGENLTVSSPTYNYRP